jgi:hypothetical protein
MKQNSHGVALLVPLLAVSLVLFAGIGFLVFQNSQKVQKPPKTTAPTINQASNDNLANWKIYSNKEFNFQFKYPNDYSFQEEKLEKPIIDILKIFNSKSGDNNRPIYKLLIYPNESLLDLESFFNDLYKGDLTGGSGNPFIGCKNYQAKKTDKRGRVIDFSQCYCVIGCDKSVFVKNDKVYEFISFYRDIPDQDLIFNQILSTFQFLD